MHTTDTAALALGIDRKVLDNFLTRACKRILPPGRRGLQRRIDDETIQIVAVALLLCRDLGVPASRAVLLGHDLLHGDHSVRVGMLGTLGFDVPRLRSVLQASLADAVEASIPSARGRPARKKRRGAS